MKPLIYHFFILVFLLASFSQASLVSNLEQIDKLKLKEHQSLVNLCSTKPASGSACDFIVYKATVLEAHFDYFFKHGQSETDYENTFAHAHAIPNAICLRDGFYTCLFRSLESAFRYELKTRIECSKEPNQVERLWEEIQLFSQMCKLEKVSNCFDSEIKDLEKLKNFKDKKHVDFVKTVSGYGFAQLGNDFLLKNSCDVESEKLAKRIEKKHRNKVQCDDTREDCIPKMDSYLTPISKFVDESEDYIPLTINELKLEIKDFLKKKNSLYQNKQKAFLNRLSDDDEYLSLQAEYYLKKMPIKNKEKAIDQTKRILLNYEKVLLKDLAKIKNTPATPVPSVAPVPKEKEIISKPKVFSKKEQAFVVPELSEKEMQKVIDAPILKKQELAQKMSQEFKRAMDDPSYKLPIGDLLLEYEFLSFSADRIGHLSARGTWAEIKNEFQSYVSHLRNNGSSETEIWEKTLKKANQDYTKRYYRDRRNFTSYLNGQEGNCDARTRFTMGLLYALDLQWPVGEQKAVEVFKDHVQPVSFHKASDVVEDLVTGETMSHRGTLYKPEVMIFDAIKNLDSDLVDEEAIKDLLIANSIKQEQVSRSSKDTDEDLSVYINYGSSDVYFNQEGTEVPLTSVNEFKDSSQSVVNANPVVNEELLRKNDLKKLERLFSSAAYQAILKETSNPSQAAEKFLKDKGTLHLLLKNFFSSPEFFALRFKNILLTSDLEVFKQKQHVLYKQYSKMMDELEKDPKLFFENRNRISNVDTSVMNAMRISKSDKEYSEFTKLSYEHRAREMFFKKVTYDTKIPETRRFLDRKKKNTHPPSLFQTGLNPQKQQNEEIHASSIVAHQNNRNRTEIPLEQYLSLIYELDVDSWLCDYRPGYYPNSQYTKCIQSGVASSKVQHDIDPKRLFTSLWTKELSAELLYRLRAEEESLDSNQKSLLLDSITSLFSKANMDTQFGRTRPGDDFVEIKRSAPYASVNLPIDVVQVRLELLKMSIRHPKLNLFPVSGFSFHNFRFSTVDDEIAVIEKALSEHKSTKAK